MYGLHASNNEKNPENLRYFENKQWYLLKQRHIVDISPNLNTVCSIDYIVEKDKLFTE